MVYDILAASGQVVLGKRGQLVVNEFRKSEKYEQQSVSIDYLVQYLKKFEANRQPRYAFLNLLNSALLFKSTTRV